MDFMHRLKDFIESRSYTPDIVKIGSHTEETPSYAIKPSPSNINERYLDKGKIYPFSFQVLIHEENDFKGYDNSLSLLADIEYLSTNLIVSNDNSFKLLKIDCTSTPSHVQHTAQGTLWTAIYNAELEV